MKPSRIDLISQRPHWRRGSWTPNYCITYNTILMNYIKFFPTSLPASNPACYTVIKGRNLLVSRVSYVGCANTRKYVRKLDKSAVSHLIGYQSLYLADSMRTEDSFTLCGRLCLKVNLSRTRKRCEYKSAYKMTFTKDRHEMDTA